MTAVAVHHSPCAGYWYPSDPKKLRRLLDDSFRQSGERIGTDLLPGAAGLVVPHAGIAYSGTVAAAVYRSIERDRPERVIILGFAHRGSPPGAWIPDIERYATPLGETAVDREATGQLLASGAYQSMREDALCDHSVEIQLPFLRKAVPEARVVPVYVSALDEAARSRAARALTEIMGPGAVAVASSDFTHYGDAFRYKPFPQNDQTPARLRALDDGFIEALGSLDSSLLLRALQSEAATVCGREPLTLLQETIRRLPEGEEHFQRTLDYQTSGEVTGDYSHCVSYAALGLYPWRSFHLDPAEQRLLLDSARETLRAYQETGRRTPKPPARITARLNRKAGVFVTLHQNGQLRGCVGRISGSGPLSHSVPEMTLAAALEDSRFDPLGREERGIDLEVSVLSPMKRLVNVERFRAGRDGGCLKAGGLSGLLLPQVAEGRAWTSREFLQALARKTGVAESVYRDPEARLYVFRAQVIR